MTIRFRMLQSPYTMAKSREEGERPEKYFRRLSTEDNVSLRRESHDDNMPVEHDASQVIDTCIRKDGARYYKIRWKDSWEREDALKGFEKLVDDFWMFVEKQRNQRYSENGEHTRDDKTPSPSPISSGRRKGRPKKLISHHDNCDKQTSYSNHEMAYQVDDEADLLSVEIPMDRRNKTPYHKMECLVEEYPVMILNENNEDSSISANNETGATHSMLGHNHVIKAVDDINFKPSPPPALIGKRKHSADNYKNEMKIKSTISTSQIFMGQPLDLKPHTANYVTVLKPLEDYKIPEGLSMMYQSQNINNNNNNNTKLPYFLSDRNMYQSINKPVIIERSQTLHDETSNLLLKVTSPSFISSSNTVNSAIVSTTSARLTEQDHLSYPIKQETSKPVSAITKVDTKTKEKMLYHVTADGEQRPQCSECFQTFKKRAALERHMMIHRGIKPFQCHFCNQRFRQKHHLQGHIMLHTGERPHSCTLCNKRFRMRHHLLEHERISHKLFR